MGNQFKKVLRKIRIDNDITQAQMAKVLNVSLSFLSSVANEKSALPKTMLGKLLKNYDLADCEKRVIFKRYVRDNFRLPENMICENRIDDFIESVAARLLDEYSYQKTTV
ncbi:helix-turn-helix transcriptional regulator [Kingella kingae]|uniref:helix-turn-helix domain-containing protein n=1 Tax=Kingella kingae TaxID=504 RepID=UPI00254ADE11|nr:helix-turn-helix transcriptional regulator [Kingella kingae]MDK4587417.1 helix-turn-helix transcriptional regulator [Kingella kingae]MDK4631355.1 helix-turn-helix transcriptional regulator [Kingella kingae]MDK4657217.1 helix-turn-helix transcriptional regulator [Kingella kingae]